MLHLIDTITSHLLIVAAITLAAIVANRFVFKS